MAIQKPKNRLNFKKFIQDNLKIKTKTGEIVYLKLNEPQKKYFKVIEKLEKENKPVRVIILKARQQGFSTATESYIYTKTSTQFNINSGIVAHIDEATNNLFNMSKLYYNMSPKELQPTLKASNARVLEFDNKDSTGLRSKITCMTAGGSGVGRSYTYHYLHISEYAFWTGDKKSTLNGLMQSVPNLPNTAIIIESTANGYEHFKELWDMAVAGETDFIPIFSAWWELDEYRMPYWNFELSDEEVELKKKYNLDNEQLAWRRWCIKNNCGGDKDLFRQEYPSCVTYDTRIGTNLGLIKIGEAKTAENATFGKIKRYIENPVAQIYKLTTKSGYSLRGTYEHPIFLDNNETQDLGSLKTGQLIKLKEPMLSTDYCTFTWNDFGVAHSIKIDEKWGRFLGYFMGDGSLSCDTLSIACDAQDADIVADCKSLIEDIFGVEAHTRLMGEKKGCTEVRVSNVKFKPLFDTLGLLRRNGSYGIKRNVHVPEIIFKSPKSVVIEFLKGLFEADGYNDYRQPRIIFFSKYNQFVKDVQLLLLACGVTSKFSTGNRKNGKGYEYVSNELILSGHRAIAFQEKVGFIGKRKIEKINYPKLASATKNELVDEVISVELDGFENTYNLTIDEIHEFDANGIHTHNCPEEAFLVSGTCIFDQDILNRRIREVDNIPVIRGEFAYTIKSFEKINDYTLENITFKTIPKGYFKIFKQPEQNHFYCIGGDTAGAGADNFVAQVIDNTTGEQVAILCHKYNEDLFAKQLYCIGKYYNDALIGVESNFSPYTNYELQKMHYPKLYVRANISNFTLDITKSYGVRMTGGAGGVRQVIISNLVELVREEVELINDADTLREMLTFVKNEKTEKAEAMAGTHDDRVMALGIAHFIRNQQDVQKMPKPQEDIRLRKTPLTIDQKIKGMPKISGTGRGDKLIVI